MTTIIVSINIFFRICRPGKFDDTGIIQLVKYDPSRLEVGKYDIPSRPELGKYDDTSRPEIDFILKVHLHEVQFK